MEKNRYDEIEDNYSSYIRDLKNYPLLTFEQEQELAERVYKGDHEAREKLIKSNLKLVIKIAMHYFRPRYNILDLIQEGNIGLMLAVDRFNYARKLRFSTYASWWIKHYIVRSILQKEFHINLPLRKVSLLLKMEKAIFEFIERSDRTPDIGQLEQELKVNAKKIKEVMEYIIPVISLNTVIDTEKDISLMDIISSGNYQPDEMVFNQYLKEYQSKILNSLINKRDAEILKYRYGLYNSRCLTLKQAANIFGLTSEAVRQIEIKTLKRIRMNNKELKDYLVN